MRKAFTTTLDRALVGTFKKACAKDGLKMNDVLEALMSGYISGQLKVSFSYQVAAKNQLIH